MDSEFEQVAYALQDDFEGLPETKLPERLDERIGEHAEGIWKRTAELVPDDHADLFRH